MSEPLVSVVIATWNTGRYLPETLASALTQTHPRCEIIVVDDGSTDDTAARIEPFLSRIRFIRREHGGLAAARNAGLAVASGDYVALLDADDIWLPEKLAVQLAVARRNPQSGLIGCDGVEFDGDVRLHESLLSKSLLTRVRAESTGEVVADMHEDFLRGSPFACPAQTLVPKRIVDEIGPFIDSGGQDYDFFLRVAQRHPIAVHRDSLVRWRYRPDSMSGPFDERRRIWGWTTLDVLTAHAERCTPAERRIIEQRRGRLVRSLARQAYRAGRDGDRGAARSELVRLAGVRSWPPYALIYLLRLMTVAPLRAFAAEMRRLAQRSGRE